MGTPTRNVLGTVSREEGINFFNLDLSNPYLFLAAVLVDGSCVRFHSSCLSIAPVKTDSAFWKLPLL